MTDSKSKSWKDVWSARLCYNNLVEEIKNAEAENRVPSQHHRDLLFEMPINSFLAIVARHDTSWHYSDAWRKPLYPPGSLSTKKKKNTQLSSEYWSHPPTEKLDREFHSFFNLTTSYEDMLAQGADKFNNKILSSDIRKLIGDNVSEKTALEIGFGAGRLMLHACKEFKEVLGIDIHNAFDRVKEVFKSEGIENYKLLDAKEVGGIPGDSIDCIYSYIVFQHLDSLDVAQMYLRESYRMMKSGAIGVLYFGINNFAPQMRAITYMDPDPGGFSLLFNPWYVQECLSDIGFEFIFSGAHDAYDKQFVTVFRKR